MADVIDGQGESDVPCGTCTACCRSSQFIGVAPDEHAAIAAIGPSLLFPAPGAPAGHVLVGYDEQGRCPMLRDDACSIYDDRPRTCRAYDCRVFAATGVVPSDQPLVAERVVRWRFRRSSPADDLAARALRAAAEFARANRDHLPAHLAPRTALHQAIVAVELHERFVDATPTVADVVTGAPDRTTRPALDGS